MFRIGRTGRIGYRGKSVTFIDSNGVNYDMSKKFVEQVRNAGQTPPDWLVKMGDGEYDRATDNTGGFGDDRNLPAPETQPAADDW